MKKDKRIDVYILNAADFAKPVLMHIRELVHIACPDAEETIKWGMPHFDYKGTLCGMAAFKQHCAIGFPKASLMKDAAKLTLAGKSSMGNYGKVSSLKDLPADRTIIAHVKEAMKLNEKGIKVPKAPPVTNKDIVMPDYFTKALSKNKEAKSVFQKFSPSHKREYLEWITEAKTEETRKKRLNQAIEWMEEGKSRNWKYMRK